MHTIDNDILLEEIRNQLSQGRKVKLRAKGNSMRPFIRSGEDTLVLAPVVEALRRGDIVLARIDGIRYVVHRIIRLKDDLITLMGDGNLHEAEECSAKDIYGTVESILRNGKARSLNSSRARLMATAWRLLLPLRRLIAKTSNIINRK